MVKAGSAAGPAGAATDGSRAAEWYEVADRLGLETLTVKNVKAAGEGRACDLSSGATVEQAGDGAVHEDLADGTT
ncbi:MAG: hypothetical protein ACRDPG_10955, partial [Nocardioidaceae bacterium]